MLRFNRLAPVLLLAIALPAPALAQQEFPWIGDGFILCGNFKPGDKPPKHYADIDSFGIFLIIFLFGQPPEVCQSSTSNVRSNALQNAVVGAGGTTLHGQASQ